MKNKKIITISLILAFFVLFFNFNTNHAKAQILTDSSFNPNRILEDSEMFNYDDMGLTEIQNFLGNKGSYLANYSTLNAHGDVKTAAEIIYDATHKNYDCWRIILSDNPTETEKKAKCRQVTTINPKLILVTLEKEESLITLNPSDTRIPIRLNLAMGYDIPDGKLGCTPYDRFCSFGKQINSASLQFLAYMNEPEFYNFQVGQTYIAKDQYGKLKSIAKAINDGDYNSIMASPNHVIVTPQNKATAALYNYTPHVFNGNYNFYTLWNKYFPETSGISRIYPSGSVIKALDNPQVWLIENGYKRLFNNWSAFISRFSPKQIVNVTSSDLANYPTGNIIKFANYSVVQTPDKTIYLLVDKEKRPFANEAVFKKIGFNPAEIETASLADLNSYQIGSTITATSTYVTGALLQDNKTNNIYYIQNSTRALVDKILLPIRFPYQKIIKTTTSELKNYATTSPLLLNEGTLVKTNNFPTVYLISNGKKRPFADETVFTKLNYDYNNVLTVSSQFLYNYDMGDPIQ